MNDALACERRVPDTDESRQIWNEIWSKQEQHFTGTEWLCSLKQATSSKRFSSRPRTV